MTSVLIVEDQRMPRENMEHLVEDSGRYRRVASLSTAEMALAQCARHTVDLVLMDVCTKGSRDGIDVAAEIKARYPETKVIIITSMVEESYLKRAKAAGAESFWYKDVSPESLLEVMDRTMAGESLYCWVSVKQFSKNDTATACQDWLRSTRLGRGSIKSHVRTVKVLGMGLFAFQERIHLWKGVTH